MSTITLPNIRVSSDLTVKLKLKDGGVALDWSTLTNIKVSIYSDAQRALAGRCSVAIDEDDATLLVCTYAANKPQYVGVNRVVVSAKYMNETKTYDKPAFNFVRWTDDQEGQTITIDDPDIDVEISVEDVSSSILQEAVDAANTAAERANEAAEAAEHMVDIHTGPAGKSPYIGENGHWYEWDEETGQYVDTETNAKGDTGETPDITIGTVTTAEPGTPAAATMTGTPEDPVLNLTIPKGAVGATPNFTIGTVTTGEPGTPVVVTLTGTPEAPVLNITIPQGMQGNTGSSVDYPYELVNNLTTNDATKGLSAAQGYVLDGKVSQLEHEVHNLSGKYYGIFSAPGELPEADTPGYAFVGATEPLTLFNYNGEEWLNTDIQIAGIIGPEGKQGLQGIQGIQGPAGITSAVASADNQTGIPYVEVSVENGVASFIFHNIKGEQGNSGYSGAAGELEVVNNTTQGGSTSALSAEMGKELQGQIDGFTGDAEADLDIVDDNGSVLARFENGDFRVKNFNSALAPQQGENNITPDFAIADENGNAIAIFRDGHIQTKNFDSNEATRTPWYGKKVSIIGDSISTAIDHNAVEFTVLASDISAGRTLQGYPTYYDIGTKIGTKTVTSAMVGVLTSFTPASGDAGKTIGKAENYNTSGTSGVASYTDTWWHKLTTALGMQVLQNVSWSGASICSHEGDADAYKTSYAWHPAQINKLATRNASGVTIAPDVVIIYRGTNDMTHTPYASLTDFGADATSIPDTDFANSSYDFKAAYCLTVKKIREAYPQAKIVLCTLNVFKRINYSQFPTNNGINTLPEYNNAIREVADMMGCGLIEFDKDGITFENCYPTYISDSSTESTHPNPTGHTAMAEKAIIDIKKY